MSRRRGLLDPDQGATETDDHTVHHHEEHYLALLFLFMCLLVGAFFRQTMSNLPIPYTVVLLLFGLAVGFIVRQTDALGDFGESATRVANMDPHLLLFTFLPPLIFESSFSIEFHVLKKIILKALLLAGPGLLFNTGCLGAFTRTIYPDWSWELCFMFGSILSATDPVAVVALLRETGASKSLSTLIEAESLLNDGTAIVVFLVLFKGVQEGGLTATFGEILWQFVRMSIGGPIFGACVGAVALFWISLVFNDALVEITVTLACAYITFYVAEAELALSGVLAVLALGIMFAKYGYSKISPEVMHFLHEFWSMMGYLANTLIFIITGVTIMLTQGARSAGDYGKFFLVYLVALLARTLFFFACLPLFKRMHYGFSAKEATVASWGGLRGAVGLSLGLLVHNEKSISEEQREMVLFHVAGLVMATLFINAPTTELMLTKLGMLDIPAVKAKMLLQAQDEMVDVTETAVADMKRSPFLSHANWGMVYQITGEDEEFKTETRQMKLISKKGGGGDGDTPEDKKKGGGYGSKRRSMRPAPSSPEALKLAREAGLDTPTNNLASIIMVKKAAQHLMKPVLAREVRRRVLMSMKSQLTKQYGDGMLGAEPLAIMSSVIDDLVDAVDAQLDSKPGSRNPASSPPSPRRRSSVVPESQNISIRWSAFEKYFYSGTMLQHHPIFGGFARRRAHSKIELGIDMAQGFFTAAGMVSAQLVASSFMGKHVSARVAKELDVEKERARNSLDDMLTVFPEICVAVTTRHAARQLLNVKRRKAHQLGSSGIMEDTESERLVSHIESKMKRLAFFPPSVDLPDKAEALMEIPWMRDLDPDTFQVIMTAAVPVVFKKTQNLVEQGGVGDAVFLIIRGHVSIQVAAPSGHVTHLAHLGVGLTIGELSLLTGSLRSSTVQAESNVLTYCIPNASVAKAMATNPEFTESLWFFASRHFSENVLKADPKYANVSHGNLQRQLNSWKMVYVTEPQFVQPMDSTIILLHGVGLEFHRDRYPGIHLECDEPIYDPVVEYTKSMAPANSQRENRSPSGSTDSISPRRVTSRPLSAKTSSASSALRRSLVNMHLPTKVGSFHRISSGGESGAEDRPTPTSALPGVLRIPAPRLLFRDVNSCLYLPIGSRIMVEPVGANRDISLEQSKVTLVREVKWIDATLSDKVSKIGVEREYPEGAYINRTGEILDRLVIVGSGLVFVELEMAGNLHTMGVTGMGGCVGETGLLTGSSQKVRIRAKSAVSTVEIKYSDLQALMKEFPHLTESLRREATSILGDELLRVVDEFKRWTRPNLNEWLKGWKFVVYTGDKRVATVRPPFVLVSGSGETKRNRASGSPQRIVEGPSMVDPKHHSDMFGFNTGACLLIPPDVSCGMEFESTVELSGVESMKGPPVSSLRDVSSIMEADKETEGTLEVAELQHSSEGGSGHTHSILEPERKVEDDLDKGELTHGLVAPAPLKFEVNKK